MDDSSKQSDIGREIKPIIEGVLFDRTGGVYEEHGACPYFLKLPLKFGILVP